jgi:casein kinase 1
MYFLRGSLPWQGLKVDKREDRYKKIYEKKKNTTAEELCGGFPSKDIFLTNFNFSLFR